MTLVEFFRRCLDQNYKSVVRSVNGLTPQELSWRPDPQCMSIGFIVWHYSRVLDVWFQAQVRGVPQLWEEGWDSKFDRLNVPGGGFSFTAEQLEAFRVPDVSALMGYAEAAKAKAMECLQGLDDEDLEGVMVPQRFGDPITLATLFQQLVWELNQHGGQIAYLRGMQRGIEDRFYTGGVLQDDAG